MEILAFIQHWVFWLFDFIMHIDVHLDELVSQYGWQTYFILFIIVFWETGVVVCPFLPGDSLLFAAGAIAHRPDSPLSPLVLFLVIASAAFLGDTFNYWIGRKIGPKVFKKDGRFLKKKYLDKTRDFYDHYGASTIIIARFVPIVRTFAPFVAGVGQMVYPRFMFFNIIGGVSWSAIFITAGYLFGGLSAVRKNFTMVILAIIVISVMPMVIEAIKIKRQNRLSQNAPLAKPKVNSKTNSD
ncbi:MAG: DedA family protein [Deltaproteobacteria bacterium]|jgi:membrane-associated protein|nr:DedA family protein [Deltaproteobacteria bacterium]